MLGFSLSALAGHKEPIVRVTSLANPPAPDPDGLPVLQNVVVSGTTTTQTYVTWTLGTDDDAGVTICHVQCYSSQVEGVSNIYVTSKTGRITALVDSLTPGTTYTAKVSAIRYASGGAEYSSDGWAYSNSFLTLSVPSDFTGLKDSVWYINGEPAAGLFNTGAGVHDGEYYIQGNATGFQYVPGLGWCGIWAGLIYIGGNVANGHYSCSSCTSAQLWFVNGGPIQNLYFVNGVAIDYTLATAANGTGSFGGVYYSNWQPYTGSVNGIYYNYGQSTALDSSGSGTVSNGDTPLYYVNGQKFTGQDTSSGIFYINGVATDLGPDGTGVVDGKYYYGGMYVGEVANPYDSGQTSSQGSRFSAGVTYA